MRGFIAALVMAATVSAGPALAANAKHPYRNIDHSVDRGNATGDREVERLNQQQLDMLRGQTPTSMTAPFQGAPLYTPVVPASKGLPQ